jgi:hypothetical protein
MSPAGELEHFLAAYQMKSVFQKQICQLAGNAGGVI